MQKNKNSLSNNSAKLNRRSLFKGLTAGAVASTLPISSGCAVEQGSTARGIKNGRIKQSVVSWCFANHWSVEETCYQGDHIDYCLDIVKQVGSPRVKLLFDIYHVQIMDGDVIRRISECGDFIGHIHTAGNPGRGELDNNQEINYPPIMQALLDIKYQGFVGQEFIPTRDPAEGLAEAVELCDI